MVLVILAVVVMFLLHNSFWLWPLDGELPLLFGFMPFSFSFYIGYTLLATAVIALVVKLVWPDPPAGLLDPDRDEELIEP